MKVWWGLGIGGRLARVGDSPVKYVIVCTFDAGRINWLAH